MLKTEAKGFYIEGGEDKLTAYADSPSKNSESRWQSTSQLPFLLMTGSNNNDNKIANKKKPQIVIQKVNNNRINVGSNFRR